jgi:ribonuclease Z
MRIIFLGTTATFPTKERNHPGTYLKFRNENLLFDCGECIQRQLRIAKIPITKITRIFITHWHGDHSLGVVGLIKSLSMTKRKSPLYVYGPFGTKRRMGYLKKAFVFEPSLDLRVKDIKEGKVCGDDYFEVHAIPVKHRTPCINYYFKEKDKRKINVS